MGGVGVVRGRRGRRERRVRGGGEGTGGGENGSPPGDAVERHGGGRVEVGGLPLRDDESADERSARAMCRGLSAEVGPVADGLQALLGRYVVGSKLG